MARPVVEEAKPNTMPTTSAYPEMAVAAAPVLLSVTGSAEAVAATAVAVTAAVPGAT